MSDNEPTVDFGKFAEKARQDVGEWPGWKKNALGALSEDLVNHPSHYTSHPSGIECIQIVEHMNFCIGNAMKYLWRAGLKEGQSELQDLKKAAWYLAREIERREKGVEQ